IAVDWRLFSRAPRAIRKLSAIATTFKVSTAAATSPNAALSESHSLAIARRNTAPVAIPA
ncbi:MAG TPA: hypothetical protein VF030_10200, partial [Solirubrobacterales bacterium]